jgi:tripartite ATP-independent transporter DctP family solute receptor
MASFSYWIGRRERLNEKISGLRRIPKNRRNVEMKNGQKFWAIVLAIGILCGLGNFARDASAEVTLRYAGDLPIGNHLTRTQEFFAKRVEELSKKQIKVDVYPAGQLFAAKDYSKAVPSGAVDMAQVLLGQWTGIVPAYMIVDMPLYYENWAHIWKIMDSPVGETIKKEIEKTGVKQICWTQDGSAGFVSKSPIRKLEDWKGKKIRAYTELSAYAIRALGAAPAFMGGGEVYMALQRGTVDGAISTLTSFYDRKYFEVTKYLVIPPMAGPIYGVIINLQKWNSLTPAQQEILMAAGKETQEWARKEVQIVEKQAVEELKKKGMEVYYLPKEERQRWRNATDKPVRDAVLEKTGEPGKKLLEQTDKIR